MEIQIVRDNIQKTDLKRIAEEERRKRILERWQTFSLAEQLGNIGSEVARARHWQGKDEKLFRHSIDRALELFYFTLDDPRWCGRLREIARAREVFCDAAWRRKEYKSSLDDLNRYFLFFASAARKNMS